MLRKGKGPVATILARQPSVAQLRARGGGPATAQGQGRPRALVFCKRWLGLLDNHAEQWNTITADSHFALKTLECVAFATGRSSAYPHTTARHTGGNGGYAGQTTLATTALRGRPPSTAKRARMDDG